MQNNEGLKKSLTQEVNEFQKTDPESIKKSITTHLEYSLAKDEYTATQRDLYESIALTTREIFKSLFEKGLMCQRFLLKLLQQKAK